MDQPYEQLVKDTKLTFETPHGKRVLDRMKTFCKGNVNQSMFDAESTQQTSYNLGANAVYRYFQHLFDTDLGDTEIENCITEESEQKGI